MKKAFYFLFLYFLNFQGFGQLNIDSLSRKVDGLMANRENLQSNLDLLQAMRPSEMDAALIVFDWIDQNSNADSVMDIKANAHFYIGRLYTLKSLFAQASEHLTRAQAIAEEKGYSIVLSQTLNALGSIYQSSSQYEKAADYFEKAISVAKKADFKQGLAKASFNLGSMEHLSGTDRVQSQRKALALMQAAYKITSSLSDTQSIINQTTGIANVYTSMKNYDSAQFYLRLAGYYIRTTGAESAYINHYQAFGKVLEAKRKYDEAIEYFKQGLSLAQKYNSPRWMCQIFDGMAHAYESKGDYKMANYYNQQNIKMHNSLVSQENFVAAADIQNRYERVKKDNEILRLSAANRQNSILNRVLIGSILALVVIGFLVFANFKKSKLVLQQQKDLQERKISELEKNKKLLAVDAMLKGQEDERSRIAKELHDGLGGLLSGIRLSLVNMREKLGLATEQYELFNRPLSMLDNTISDLRKLAHNLMPEALVKYGLQDALKDFCDTIKSTTGVNVVYQQFGKPRFLDNTATVFIYRIVQELVNNVLKHAEATEIIVQMVQSETTTNITVEDNGKGFDKATVLNESTGAGMKNIAYRVQYLQGSYDISTSPGNGTSFEISVKA